MQFPDIDIVQFSKLMFVIMVIYVMYVQSIWISRYAESSLEVAQTTTKSAAQHWLTERSLQLFGNVAWTWLSGGSQPIKDTISNSLIPMMGRKFGFIIPEQREPVQDQSLYRWANAGGQIMAWR